MANDEHLKILESGVQAWNAWREEHPEVRPDLVGADLRNARLMGARLMDARLMSADLGGADLRTAHLMGANLMHADLVAAKLRGADLRGADLRIADLRIADLVGANLRSATLRYTVFGAVDLRQVKGLESVKHQAPSDISTSTLTKSQGKIPAAFLRGCGLTDWEIKNAKLWNPDLSRDELTDLTYEIVNLKAESPIMLHPLFISYSHGDTPFVEKLEAGLDKKRIRYWRDVHDMKAGRMEAQIDKAIRMNPIVLLVLSESSVESDWVEWEISKARELEKKEKRDVLCPIALDDAWKTCDWPGPLRRQVMDYNILDFSKDDAFDEQFEKLVSGIVEFYPSPAADEIPEG